MRYQNLLHEFLDNAPVLDSSLCKRAPLLSVSQLESILPNFKRKNGYLKLEAALRYVRDGAASPFEAQAAILFGFSCYKGGAGFSNFSLNRRIILSRRAKHMLQKNYVVADLLFEPNDGGVPVIVECQSKLIHDNKASYLAYADRALALETMGYHVVLLTYATMSSLKAWHSVVEHIRKKLNYSKPRQPQDFELRELDLRRNVLIDWKTLGF
ncbi:hypothetical protein KPC83_00855 [Collinsella sp. zg1085]|uniref:hypothetical protein n=1 Tax=Collinsella sp. zg1085 TaxID=2844380 RepID=UPI001C0AADFF|nr:hypothetical protein [Collinsella sp. zg1085]QWT17747.1 hypothetical protein KPC83_00855 [Collinsella sp. zg1085]